MTNYFAGWTIAEMVNNADLAPWDARNEAEARHEKMTAQRARLLKKVAKLEYEMAAAEKVRREALIEIAREQDAAA